MPLSTRRLAFRGWEFAGFHPLPEAAQVLANLLAGLLAEHPGEPGSELAAGRVVLEGDTHLGAAIVRQRREVNRAGSRDLRAGQRTPRNQAVWLIGDDLGIPF